MEPARDRSVEIRKLERRLDLERRKAERREAKQKTSEPKPGQPARTDVAELVSGLPGQTGVVVAGPGGAGPRLSAGSFAGGVAWSTIKVPIAQQVLTDAGGPDRLDAATRDRITAAVTISDNDAAAALFERLKADHGGLQGAAEAVGGVLRAAGDDTTVVSTRGRDGFSTYGQTEWSLEAQNRYLAALAGGCIADRATTRFLLGRMASVGGSDTYGLGSTGIPARWKGGWGPGTDGRYLVRQMGVLDTAGGPVVVTMAAVADDGTFESGQAMLNEIAARIADRFRAGAPAPRPC